MEKYTVNENCEHLFEYLRSTLYDKHPKEVNLEKLDDEFQKLGMGISYLQQMIGEMLQYSEAISRGNLEHEMPSNDNSLCSNLKNLHSNLKHLTWQAKQVAKGDYTQHVSYLGEFSDSFNEMITQLKDREEAIRRRNALAEEYNRFFLEMSRTRDEWIIIIDKETREELYCNRQPQRETFDRCHCKECPYRSDFLKEQIIRRESDAYSEQEIAGNQGDYYEISAFHMEWHERKAVAFVISDITEDKKNSDNLTEIAYHDALTGIKNRRYFDDFVSKDGMSESWDVFCYMDLDGLKYVNDTFGHEAGDSYIQRFVDLFSRSFRATDELIRLGGDEFCMFCRHFPAEIMTQKLESLRDIFISENTAPYPASFSYGIVSNTDHTEPFAEAMKRADEKMYTYKKAHKKERR